MLFCPKYSVGTGVKIDDTSLEGVIVGIEAVLKVGKTGKLTYKVVYLVEIDDLGVQKFHEKSLRDKSEIPPERASEMDKFLADSLLLTRHKYPEERIDNAIKELLKFDTAGGDKNERNDSPLQ